MTDNGAMSYTEGSEPIQLTEAQRIEKEALERYPKKAINGFEFPEYNVRERSAYIAGAMSQLKQRDETIKELTLQLQVATTNGQFQDEEIKQLKEVLGEVVSIAGYYHNPSVKYTDMPYKNWNDSINKARKLVTE